MRGVLPSSDVLTPSLMPDVLQIDAFVSPAIPACSSTVENQTCHCKYIADLRALPGRTGTGQITQPDSLSGRIMMHCNVSATIGEMRHQLPDNSLDRNTCSTRIDKGPPTIVF